MNRKIFGFMFLVLMAMGAWSVLAQAENPSQEVVLPRYQTDAEKALFRQLEGVGGPGGYIWDCWPELAGFTDIAPETSRWRGEHEKNYGVIFGWPSYGCQMPTLTELIRNAIGNVTVTVIVPVSQMSSAQSCLRSRGVTDEMQASINWYNANLDGIWIRDWGPEVLLSKSGAFEFVDMGYYSGRSPNCIPPFPGRPNDDVAPTRLAPDFIEGPANVYRPALRTEGGYIMTDGNGTCFRQTRDIFASNNFSEWRYSQDDIDAMMYFYLGCQSVIRLPSLSLDQRGNSVIDHMDMTTTQISSTSFLVGEMDPADDPINSAILNTHAQILTDAGYAVYRIPMPKPFCTVRRGSCISNPGDAREFGPECRPGPLGLTTRVWATYTNSIRIGNKMIVPVYRDVPASLRDIIDAQEAEALAIYQAVLDFEFGKGVVEVVPNPADRMIPCQGADHCIAMTY